MQWPETNFLKKIQNKFDKNKNLEDFLHNFKYGPKEKKKVQAKVCHGGPTIAFFQYSSDVISDPSP